MVSIYWSIYDTIVDYIFGGIELMNSETTLITILLSSLASIFVFALPFIVCWKLIKMLMEF